VISNPLKSDAQLLLAALLASSIVVSTARAQSAQGAKSPAPAAKPASAPAPTHYHPDRFAGRAGRYYRLVWGVDALAVKWTESGEVIKFSYQVLDPDKAKVLNDKKNEPSLIDPQAGVKLVVPSLEKVGQLRQTGTPEEGRVYWMAFSNKGRYVKRGDRVTVVIGGFRAEGLVVD
jgi:ABC-type Fe3+ transport system substrate-binding protein